MRTKLLRRIIAAQPDLTTQELAERASLRATRIQEIRRSVTAAE